MSKADPQRFLPLKANWFHIMLALAGGELHGYGIMQDVLNRTSGKMRQGRGTCSRALNRRTDAGLIEESDVRPTEELDDARRRYYRLTRLGKLVLNAECARLQDLVRAIPIKRVVTE